MQLNNTKTNKTIVMKNLNLHIEQNPQEPKARGGTYCGGDDLV